jgi:hypothetical protein
LKKFISFIAILLILFLTLESCEEDKELLSYIELQIDGTEYIFTGGEVDYGDAPFGFFDHLTPHVGNISHALEIYGGSENSEHYYEGEYVEVKINTGSYDVVESTTYPCSICFCSPDFRYCGDGVASILQYGGTTGYLKVSVDSTVLTNTSEGQTTKKISQVNFTVKLYGDTYSIE